MCGKSIGNQAQATHLAHHRSFHVHPRFAVLISCEMITNVDFVINVNFNDTWDILFSHFLPKTFYTIYVLNE